MTPTEFAAFLSYAREHKVQEFSVGDTHVLFSAAAMVPLTQDARTEDNDAKAALASAPVPEDENAVKKLMDDPDLFLSSDGPSPVPEA
jgi:hypothetical protein